MDPNKFDIKDYADELYQVAHNLNAVLEGVLEGFSKKNNQRNSVSPYYLAEKVGRARQALNDHKPIWKRINGDASANPPSAETLEQKAERVYNNTCYVALAGEWKDLDEKEKEIWRNIATKIKH